MAVAVYKSAVFFFGGGFRGGRAGSGPPPPLSDGLTPSLTLMLANAKFLSFYCKHGTQNIQNELPPAAF